MNEELYLHGLLNGLISHKVDDICTWSHIYFEDNGNKAIFTKLDKLEVEVEEPEFEKLITSLSNCKYNDEVLHSFTYDNRGYLVIAGGLYAVAAKYYYTEDDPYKMKEKLSVLKITDELLNIGVERQ